jgi:hypothetical protein
MTNEIVEIIEQGGRVVVRQRQKRKGFSLDTELSSRPVGLMAIAKAEKDGLIRPKGPGTRSGKNVTWEYELIPTQKKLIKVFCMNDCDWMAGATLEECKAEYINNYGGDAWDDADGDQFEDAHELSPEAMQRLKFTDEDGTRRSFQEQLDKMIAEDNEFPQFFASTEC